MSKKLPNIFKGKASRNNNQESSIINSEKLLDNNDANGNNDVNKQIKDVFNSENFVYKADTIITLNNGEILKKTIIGKTSNSLITLDDELIDVSSISKIELD